MNGGCEMIVVWVMWLVVFVLDFKLLDVLLWEMQCDCNYMVLLVDEYGVIVGFVSIEDVLEEIVGEIVDEYDQVEMVLVEDLGDKCFWVLVCLFIEDVGELYGVEFDDDFDVDMVGGLLVLELGWVLLFGVEVILYGLWLYVEGGIDYWGWV